MKWKMKLMIIQLIIITIKSKTRKIVLITKITITIERQIFLIHMSSIPHVN